MSKRSRKKTPPTVSPSLTPAASRRGFLKGGGMMLAGGAIVGTNLSVAKSAYAFGSDTIRIGLVGCGNRGVGAAMQMLDTGGDFEGGSNSGSVRLVAMGDCFENNLHTAYRTLRGHYADQVDVRDSRFVGLDAYQKVIDSDADIILLATPPGFRPLQFESAVQAGKHVFMEKPLATDAVGVNRILAANEIAKQNGLAVQVGFQRRHDLRYRQTIEQIHSGAIGEPIFARAYWNGSGNWVRPRTKDQTELEYQLRNWYYFTWLSGDHIVEQHVHNLDIINWAIGTHPIEAQGQGGREVRRGSDHGQIFDHHMVEFIYPGGTRLLSQCRHIKGCSNQIGEHLHGTVATADISSGVISDLAGNRIWESGAEPMRSDRRQQQEQTDFVEALRRGETPNEVDDAAASTMTAILGRMATYSGKRVKWNDAIGCVSSLANLDAIKSFNDPAPLSPDKYGKYPKAIPGQSTPGMLS
ncbi:Inositol 2-dehydrogenase [Planctomycetes bacterium CA13]|uniref:Inositol 2-dehydrogenase n=1 Tax=Novipirellula herctigrandis TaxID=2527986 RepID=A0A5C5YZ07_9BACT|nr:Inositol 2-dehydrogenase [Planctomycetes bacterium CA13]